MLVPPQLCSANTAQASSRVNTQGNTSCIVAWKKVGVCGVWILLEEDGSGCFTLSAARRAPRTPEQRGRFVCSACCLVADSRGVEIRGVEVGVS